MYQNLELDGPRKTVPSYLSRVWRFRHLGLNLAGSDLRARFRRSRLGIIWAVVQPMGFAILIALVWGQLFGGDTWSYAIYVMSGLLVWEYFSNSVLVGMDSLTNAEGYIKQTRIPFLTFQLRTPMTGFVVFLLGNAGLFILMGVLSDLPRLGWHLLLVPVFPFLLFGLVAPLAVVVSIMGTQFRDLKHATQLLLTATFFLSPVMLAREYLANERVGFLAFVNPVIPLLDLYRAPILHDSFWSLQPLLVVLGWIAGLSVIAVLVTRAVGRRIIFAL